MGKTKVTAGGRFEISMFFSVHVNRIWTARKSKVFLESKSARQYLQDCAWEMAEKKILVGLRRK